MFRWSAALILIATSLFQAGCAPLNGGAALQHFGGLEYKTLSGAIDSDGERVFGSGRLIFRMPRPADDSNFAFTASLSPKGSATLISNSDRSLSSGVRLKFARRENDSLGVELRVGSESFDVSEDFDGISAAQPLTVSVDVHAHGHALVWISGKELEYAFSTRVAGKLWGMELAEASVSKASAGAPKKPEGR